MANSRAVTKEETVTVTKGTKSWLRPCPAACSRTRDFASLSLGFCILQVGRVYTSWAVLGSTVGHRLL